MNWWQILLFPFAILYDLVTRSRNWLYENDLKKIHTYPDLTIISVGNLSVGGTGKTPMVEYLIRYGLNQNWKMAALSRGYRRKSRGVQIVCASDSADTVGDESFSCFEQFGERISVVVAEKRAKGIETIKRSLPEVKVILLDDAYQHRSVQPDVSFLLTTEAKPFWKGFLLPSGRLREARQGYKRADVMIVTKSIRSIEIPIEIPHAFSSVNYGNVVLMAGENKEKVVAVAGLSNTTDFFDHVSAHFDVRTKIRFPDHYSYKQKEILRIIKVCEAHESLLITTHKDAVKLKIFEEMGKISWGYLPIAIAFIAGEDKVLKVLQPLGKRVFRET